MTLKSETMICRNCKSDGACEHILTVENQPGSAQGFFDEQAAAYRKVDLEIFECGDCGLVQHALEPVSYYKDVIRSVAYSTEMKQFRLRQFKELIGHYKLCNRRILEIGSGRGEYLDLFHEAGANTLYGLENSLDGYKYIRRKKYNVHRGFLDDNFVNPWDHDFDAVVCFNFLEHWPDLRSGLSNLNSLLSSDGIGLIEVPNFDYILRNKIYSEFTIDHIYYFTEISLRNVLQGVGFEVINIESIWKDYILSALVRRRRKIDALALKEKKEMQTAEITRFLENYHGTLVVWGAGHQALSILAMIGAEKFISYVVDSAPFKQGKYCPVTGLKIFSPGHLDIECPRGVIVMGAGYSAEIAKIIQNDFRKIPDVFILNEDGIGKIDG